MNVSCEWTVLLNASGDNLILDINEDAARYLTTMKRRKPISNPPPVFPAGQGHLKAAVKMMVHIDASGHVDKAVAISGPDPLRTAAVNAVKTWIYEPLLVESNPIPLETLVTIHFNRE